MLGVTVAPNYPARLGAMPGCANGTVNLITRIRVGDGLRAIPLPHGGELHAASDLRNALGNTVCCFNDQGNTCNRGRSSKTHANVC